MLCVCGQMHTGHTACPYNNYNRYGHGQHEPCIDCELRLKTSWFGEPPKCPKHRKKRPTLFDQGT